MNPTPGRAAAALVLAAALLVLTAMVPRPAAGQAPGDGSVFDLAPAPGAVVGAGPVELRARLHTDQPITAARFAVGGGRWVEATVGAHDPAQGTQVHASAVLPTGDHALRVEGVDAAGLRRSRAWWITATDRSVRRYAGPSRIDTAVAASTAAFPARKSAPAAVLARADDFADALAGVPLATAVGGPLLLSSGSTLSPTTADELERVLAPGGIVHMLGGEGALAEAVERALHDRGLPTTRHGGADRYATAAAVAEALPASSGAVVASGVSFPDALAASAPAARQGWPILLTSADHVPAPTAAVLAGRGVTDVTIVGGAAAVSAGAEAEVRRIATSVTRVAGPDRYATAAAVLDAFYAQPAGVSLASGTDFPDALSGTRHAVLLDQPVLLTRPSGLPAPTAGAIRTHRPRRLDVYGGSAAVTDHAVQEALHAAIDGPEAPRVMATVPGPDHTLAALGIVTVRLDRVVDPARSSVHVEVGGTEVAGKLDATGVADTLTFRPHAPVVADRDVPWPSRILIRAVTPEGAVGRHAVAFTYLEPDPVYATAGAVALHLPSRDVEMIGFHESMHPGAQQQSERPTATPRTTLATRHRGTGSHTAADVVASPDLPVLAPVTGRVLRAGAYVLYCRYHDAYTVIEPDAHPGWEVKVLHFRGLRVRVGDRVVAHETVIGDGPRPLPFSSQVDDASTTRWPHLHIEVIDPSIPPRPGGGC